jgi:ubiquinol-cytochrome c reductase cytochrome b subunit
VSESSQGLGASWWRRRLGQASVSWPDESAPSAARWPLALGLAILALLLLQLSSGLALALHYSPSLTSAWESVFFIETRVLGGSFLRALHHHGASAIVLLALIHALVGIATRAYRAPRELNWWLGLLLFGLIFVFALTGYLLPWDERGFGATQVATGLMALTPGIGESLRRVVLGGSGYGHLTLTRFYAVHVILLPAVLCAILTAHLALRRRLGASAVDALESAPKLRFWPDILSRGLALDLGFIALLAIYAATHPAPLMAPADPATSFPARPEWYFLPIFQLLKTPLFEGSREVLGSHGVPALVLGFLAALPWIDRKSERGRHRVILAIVAALLLGALSLSVYALLQDSQDEAFRNEVIKGEERRRLAFELARDGIPPAGALVMMRRSAWSGAAIFLERCASCHEGAERKAPILDGYMSEDWVAEFIKNPNEDRFYGRTKLGAAQKMAAYPLSEPKRRALARFLLELGDKADRQAGAELFEEKGCVDCHDRGRDLACQGPNLHGFGSPEWILRVIEKPDSPLCYGGDCEMPAYQSALNADQKTALLGFLASLKARPVAAAKATAVAPQEPPKEPKDPKVGGRNPRTPGSGRRGIDENPR